MKEVREIPYAQVVTAVLESDLEPGETIITDYSGRYMFGDQCFGLIVANSSEAARVLFKLHASFKEDGFGDDELEDMLFGWTEDDMGLDLIVYFPGVKLTELPGASD